MAEERLFQIIYDDILYHLKFEGKFKGQHFTLKNIYFGDFTKKVLIAYAYAKTYTECLNSNYPNNKMTKK